jgi:hypothetical protein
MFKCSSCGHQFDELLIDGYSFGDRLLEGVMFTVRVKKGNPKVVGVDASSQAYFSQLNQSMWLKEAQAYMEGNWDDVLGACPKCREDIIPQDDSNATFKAPLRPPATPIQVPVAGVGALLKAFGIPPKK